MFELRFPYLALAFGLAVAGCGSKDSTRDNAQNAAEAVQDQTNDLKDQSADLADTAKDSTEEMSDEAKAAVEDLKDESRDIAKNAIETRDAVKEFEYQRLVRVQTLRAVHGIAASQPMLIAAVASSRALVAADRRKIDEKLQLVQMRLDESANLIQSLEGVDAEHWVDREREVAGALDRLEDAREDAWEVLADARRLDQTSMR